MEFDQIALWLVGGIGVPIVGYFKSKLGWDDRAAMILTIVITFLIATIALFVSQELAVSSFTLENLVAVFGQVIAAATIVYGLWPKE